MYQRTPTPLPVHEHQQLALSLLPYEKADITLLNAECGSGVLSPRTHPRVMTVGIGAIREATILREFLYNAHNIPPQNSEIHGCSLCRQFVPDTYSSVQTGEFGNAKDESLWTIPLASLPLGSVYAYDATYIRHPNLEVADNWADVFRRAISTTVKDGAVISFVRSLDERHINRFLDLLEVHPFKRREIHSSPEGSTTDHHTLLVFRGSARA